MDSPGPRRPRAYRVPFRLERMPAAHLYRIVNEGGETLHGIALTIHGSGLMAASPPSLLKPGDALEVSIAGADIARDTILVVRWFRPSGVEYLWRVSF